MWIDTHCHLTYPDLAAQTAAVLQRAAAAGVGRLITVGTSLPDHAAALALVRGHAQVFAALGIHPHHAGEVEAGYERFVEHLLRTEAKVLAVGECGLDYHYDYAPKLLQKGVFLNQLEIARRVRKPVVLHVREAHADAQAMVRDFPELQCVVHCFTGTPDECRGWLDMGAYVGFTGIVTYKNAPEVRASCKLVPADRIVVETDAPYLPPEPVRSKKPCEPAYVVHTGEFVAALRGVPPEDLSRQTTENAARLFGERLLGV
jgi:TatD DNase family protein